MASGPAPCAPCPFMVPPCMIPQNPPTVTISDNNNGMAKGAPQQCLPCQQPFCLPCGPNPMCPLPCDPNMPEPRQCGPFITLNTPTEYKSIPVPKVIIMDVKRRNKSHHRHDHDSDDEGRRRKKDCCKKGKNKRRAVSEESCCYDDHDHVKNHHHHKGHDDDDESMHCHDDHHRKHKNAKRPDDEKRCKEERHNNNKSDEDDCLDPAMRRRRAKKRGPNVNGNNARTRSRELRGGILYVGCDCEKRNGLQDDCRRSLCHGSPECRTVPPTCIPSQYSSGKHLMKAMMKRREEMELAKLKAHC